MISYTHKCIFIEVPKTGSTSIRSIIGSPQTPHLDINEVRRELSYQVSWYKKITGIRSLAYNISPKFVRRIYGEHIFNSYYKFGFVRNPWSRVVSLYNRKEGIQMRNELSFDEFVDWINLSSDTCIHPSPKKNQLDWFLDQNQEVAVDFIGKFENLNEDWEIIRKKLGVDKKLPHKNINQSSDRKHYTDYYTEKTKDIIREKFIKDIEYFNYKFGE